MSRRVSEERTGLGTMCLLLQCKGWYREECVSNCLKWWAVQAYLCEPGHNAAGAERDPAGAGTAISQGRYGMGPEVTSILPIPSFAHALPLGRRRPVLPSILYID